MHYRIEGSRESGIMLWLEAPCGFKQPIIRWANLDGMKRFADMLLDFHEYQMKEGGIDCGKKDDEVKVISDELLKQALGDSDQN